MPLTRAKNVLRSVNVSTATNSPSPPSSCARAMVRMRMPAPAGVHGDNLAAPDEDLRPDGVRRQRLARRDRRVVSLPTTSAKAWKSPPSPSAAAWAISTSL